MKHVLLLDNYDSFTYNLKHYISSLGYSVDVVRNDDLDLDISKYSHIVLSPGPGLPKDAGVMMELIDKIASSIPILGVCLGMQAISEYLGGTLYNQLEVKHGVEEMITIDNSAIFKGLNSEFKVGLYHSWAVSESGNFNIIGRSKLGIVMAIENVERKLYGVQFHPESIMTPEGVGLIENFLRL